MFWEPRVRVLFIPALLFIALFSMLPHKEVSRNKYFDVVDIVAIADAVALVIMWRGICVAVAVMM